MHKIAYKKTLGFFFKNPAVSVPPPYDPLTSCEISEKFNTRLLRFAPDGNFQANLGPKWANLGPKLLIKKNSDFFLKIRPCQSPLLITL